MGGSPSSRDLHDTDLRDIGRTAWGIGLAYGVVGVAWILLSDAMALQLAPDAGWLQLVQRYKGLAYVCLTTLGLVALVRVGYRHLLQARRRAHSSDLQVQDLFMNHPMPMWVYDLQTLRILTVNAAALATYGHTREQFLGLTACDLRPPEDVAFFRAALDSRLEGHGRPGVFRHRTRGGQVLHARITDHSIDFQGRPAMMVMAEDVTEEVRLQHAVQRQQAQFRQLHQSLGEVLWMASSDGQRLLYVSPAFATIYGRSVDELMARPSLWLQMVHPDDRAQTLTVQDLSPARPSLTCRYRIVRPDGTVRWIEDRKSVIRDETGQVVMLGGIAEDITVQKERDDALAQLNGRLEQLVGERTRELEQANIELEAFSRTAAHDLKSPLNGIVGLSQLLQLRYGAVLDDTGRRYAGQIERSARDMAALINDLLTLSRAGSAELQRHWVDLRPMAEAIVDELRLLDPLRPVQVSLPDTLRLHCDAGLMRSVLQNLIGNAWKFSAANEAARIELVCEADAAHTRLTIADNGAGFDSAQVPALFRPFQRFHSQAQFQGTGLGLVTCQRIAQRHGGTLAVQSHPGQGTRVTLTLPNPAGPAASPVVREAVAVAAGG